MRRAARLLRLLPLLLAGAAALRVALPQPGERAQRPLLLAFADGAEAGTVLFTVDGGWAQFYADPDELVPVPWLPPGPHSVSAELLDPVSGATLAETAPVRFTTAASTGPLPPIPRTVFAADLTLRDGREERLRMLAGETVRDVARRYGDAALEPLLEEALASQDLRRETIAAQARRALLHPPHLLKLMVGAVDEDAAIGWISTNAGELDVTHFESFAELLNDQVAVAAVLAEHVWEHLSPLEAAHAAAACRRAVVSHGWVRAAVPEPRHPAMADRAEDIRIGHRVRYSGPAFAAVFRHAGFERVRLLEYVAADGSQVLADPADVLSAERGRIKRSAAADARGAVSVILEAEPGGPPSPVLARGALESSELRRPSAVDCEYDYDLPLEVELERGRHDWRVQRAALMRAPQDSRVLEAVARHFQPPPSPPSQPQPAPSLHAAAPGLIELHGPPLDPRDVLCVTDELEETVQCVQDPPRRMSVVNGGGLRAALYPAAPPPPPPQSKRIALFTIVLNGARFLPHHARELPRLGDELGWDWEWHVVEGVAEGRPYSREPLPGEFFDAEGRSVDGTSAYLDALAAMHPGRVHVRRGRWPDKLAMANAALAGIEHACTLVQLDVDELWTAEALADVAGRPAQCTYVDCHFFVAPRLVATTPGAYGHNDYEWLRVWQGYDPARRLHYFYEHAPPTLASLSAGQWVGLNGDRCTRDNAITFTHHAYVAPEQVAFKEAFYGYAGATEAWRRLAAADPAAVPDLAQWLPWVPAGVQAARAPPAALPVAPPFDASRRPPVHVMVDCVAFQLQRRWAKGIPRVWSELLPRLQRALRPDDRLSLLVHGSGPAPLAGVPVVRGPPFSDEGHGVDTVPELCRRAGATVFLSTYFTHCPSARNVLLVHDAIPEQLGWQSRWWAEKRRVVPLADRVVSVSRRAAAAIAGVYPGVQVSWAHNGVSNAFRRCAAVAPRRRERPYVLMVGSQAGYKNGHVAVAALAGSGVDVVVAGGSLPGAALQLPYLTDEELAAEYRGAVALVYLSIAEGFGLPVVEALSCGCPVVASSAPMVPAVEELGLASGGVRLVRPGDAQGVAAAVLELAASRPTLEPRDYGGWEGLWGEMWGAMGL